MKTDFLDASETANSLTHGAGLVLSMAGGVVLTDAVLHGGDAWRVLGCLIYAPTLIAVYAMSTLSHCCTLPRRRHFFRKLDQGCIYLLIAGTYTPFSLAYLRTGFWWAFLGVMWTIALIGFISKILLAHRIDRVLVWIYVVLGWMPVATAPALIGRVPATALWCMLAGGVFYTSGTIFLVNDGRVRHFHTVWHLFVIAGSACHFYAIFRYVAPGP